MALEDIRNERLAKLARLREAGMDPYPVHAARTHDIARFLENHAALAESGEVVTLDGRIISFREHGGSIFIDIVDGTGKTQGFLKKDTLGDDVFELFLKDADVGDFIELSGIAFTTKRGQPSVEVRSWRMLAKSILPIPDQWYGLKDEDERYRKRYLDILLSGETADRIRRRSKFWNVIRSYLLDRDFVEVETPVLETTTGGAEATPFRTHHNALDIDVYLRISAGELWQKRLMVAGLPKVFEIGRIFRNEGMSAEHAQDYTQLEFYEAYKDYRQGMEMIRDLYRTIADEVYGTRVFTIKDVAIDLGHEWETYDFCALMQEKYGFDPRDVGDYSEAESCALMKKYEPAYDGDERGIGRVVDYLWKKVRKEIAGPGFLIHVPVYLEPLAKKDPNDPRVVERFQVMLAGSEIGKGFSELNDPVDQAERFRHQGELRDAGDEEAQMPDAEYVEALEYGMPPSFGFGVSERLFAFLEGVSIREGQIFPLMRPRG
ncbi:MAG: lysine--tRNA ligase [Patescibacteria group bacterium]|nr:lysine--tRNA ligase [Patescibacteria group bacterium]MDE1965722.1 lysine--tRNA ligase [Patescibacteria group bacterium]